ncbi:Alpha/beta hydrolase fold protein [Rhodococcus sp. AW25M09]|uniref:alpha/beta fold hydrolase n=1 Tax=Rhodococcus sp. AW25M09 TaxID=1268303 RepID=UPI0002AC7D73|nr:alpha/beta hydrolase [Rhodococcus sp. AW25M09]CCQ17645.1 Alpha/beta hydrolase fold protein [Rhodococcus sp. AW25M09]
MIPSTDTLAGSDTVDVVIEGSGPPLALAHGAGGGIRLNFGELIARMSTVRTMVGIDYPGSGGTPIADAPLTLDALADNIVEAMVDAGHHRFPVLGLSLGAAVAVTAAVRHPQHVSGLLLTVGFAESDQQLEGFIALWQRLAELKEWNTLAQLMVNSGSPATLGAMTAADHTAAIAAARANYPAGGAAQAELARSVDIRNLLPEVRVPTLVAVAGQDRIVLPSNTRALTDAIADAESVEYPGAGHIFTPAETELWIDDISEFLNRRRL